MYQSTYLCSERGKKSYRKFFDFGISIFAVVALKASSAFEIASLKIAKTNNYYCLAMLDVTSLIIASQLAWVPITYSARKERNPYESLTLGFPRWLPGSLRAAKPTGNVAGSSSGRRSESLSANSDRPAGFG